MANAKSVAQVQSEFGVNLPGQWEAIPWVLYDYQAYAAAGASQLSFFQAPVGQSGKTYEDTNMVLAGQLSKNNAFLIHAIEVAFWPTVPGVAADNPAAFGAEAIANIVNDVYAINHSGYLQLTVNNKVYMTDGPLGQFPSKRNMELSAALADASTAGADLQSRIAYAYNGGDQRQWGDLPIFLEESQSFGVTLNWPNGKAVVTNPARIGIRMAGTLYRTAQ
jgi:hypothetical protein